mgnify:CR=1 FL=1
MCSILGAISCNYKFNIGDDLISRINDTLQHRGPDGNGIKRNGNVVFSHNRLSIIGLKEEYSEQPLKSNETCLHLMVKFIIISMSLLY